MRSMPNETDQVKTRAQNFFFPLRFPPLRAAGSCRLTPTRMQPLFAPYVDEYLYQNGAGLALNLHLGTVSSRGDITSCGVSYVLLMNR